MIILLCIVIITIAVTEFSCSQHFVLFKNDYITNITPLLTTTKKTLTQCLTACFYKVLCYAVSIEKTLENKHECSLYETLDFNATAWEIKSNTKVFVKLLGSCLAYRVRGFTKSGVYNILPDPDKKPFEVWCDMVKEGGGWTVLLRRESNQLSFEKNWAEYKHGFGRLDKSFWLGNDKIHEVTNLQENDLKIDLIDSVEQSFTVRYDKFQVLNESTSYTMTYDNYNQHLSKAGDCFTRFNKAVKFSTYDRDNDVDERNCSQEYGRGGWWFTNCHHGYMTGRYMEDIYAGNTWCFNMTVQHSELKVRKKLENVSYLKQTSGSKVLNQHSSDNGNDNDINTMFHVNSNLGEAAWWQVDLQKTAIIINFHYHPRSIYPRSPYQPYDIFVLTKTTASSDFQTCTSITADDFVGVTATKPYVFSCKKHTKARFIRLQKHDDAHDVFLVFNELKVFGTYL